MRYFSRVAIISFFLTMALSGNSLAQTQAEMLANVENNMVRLRKLERSLNHLHQRLQINKNELVELNQRALKNFHGNLLKVFIKGGLEIYNKVNNPYGSVCDMVAETILNLKLEPRIWTVTEDRVAILNWSKGLDGRNKKLLSLYDALDEVLRTPLEDFDDDEEPVVRQAKPFWRNGDGKIDDDKEKTTRKLNITIKLSDAAIRHTDTEMQRVRDDRRFVLMQIENQKKLRAQLVPKNEPKKPTPKVSKRAEIVKKTPSYTPREKRPRSYAEDGPRPQLTPAQLAAQKAARIEAQRQSKLRLEKLKSARVYVDSSGKREVEVGEYVVLIGKTDPPDLKAYFAWTIDGKGVSGSRKRVTTHVFRYRFDKEGIYDMQVTAKFEGKFQDTYTDQIKIVPSALAKKQKAPQRRYPPNMEGKKRIALDLPFCKYWSEYKNNQIRLTGYYYIPSGQKVNYMSLPIKHFNAQYPAAGMFVVANGTGYHVYVTEKGGDDEGGSLYVVTRMRGSEVKTLHKINAYSWQMNPAAGNAFWTVKYKTSPDGATQSLVLN
jgi:hypothetical protein